MGDGIYVALSGAIAQAANLDATAQNLANAGTDGYQRVRPVFQEELARAGAHDPAYHYTQLASTQNDTARGALRETGRPLDFVLPEGSYLAVSTPRGERYTRAASLSTGIDGVLRTAHGDPVLSEDGRTVKVQGDPGSLSTLRVDKSGKVLQDDGDVRAQLKVVTFPQPSMLAHDSGALLAATPQSGAPVAAAGDLEVGHVEESNSNVLGAMNDLVVASRTFDAFQRVIDTFRDADRSVVQNVPNAAT
jgi:flagellar basal-body rod protein FlgF